MRVIEAAARLIRNHQADKANRERGQQDLQRREVEALEEIARASSKRPVKS